MESTCIHIFLKKNYLVWMSVMHACISVLLMHSVPEEARREHHIGEWN